MLAAALSVAGAGDDACGGRVRGEAPAEALETSFDFDMYDVSEVGRGGQCILKRCLIPNPSLCWEASVELGGMAGSNEGETAFDVQGAPDSPELGESEPSVSWRPGRQEYQLVLPEQTSRHERQDASELSHQDAQMVEELLAIAARFEAVGRITEARARVEEIRVRFPSFGGPELALQRIDGARCPRAVTRGQPGANAKDDGEECQWRFLLSPAAAQQCANCDILAWNQGRGVEGGRLTVHVSAVEQGPCDILIDGSREREHVLETEGDYADLSHIPPRTYGWVFLHESPDVLTNITDFEDVDVELIEMCKEQQRLRPRDYAQWHTMHIQLGLMASARRLSWVEGSNPTSVAHLFAYFEGIHCICALSLSLSLFLPASRLLLSIPFPVSRSLTNPLCECPDVCA